MTTRILGMELRELQYRSRDAMLRTSSRSLFVSCSWFDHPLAHGTHTNCLFRGCKFDAVSTLHFVHVALIDCRAWTIARSRFIGCRIHHVFVKRTVEHCHFELSLIQHLSSKGVSHCRFELCRLRLHPMEASTWSNCHFQQCVFERLGDVQFVNCTFDGCRFPDGGSTPPASALVSHDAQARN